MGKSLRAKHFHSPKESVCACGKVNIRLMDSTPQFEFHFRSPPPFARCFSFCCSIFHSINLLGGCGNIFLPISNFYRISTAHTACLICCCFSAQLGQKSQPRMENTFSAISAIVLNAGKLLNVPGEIVLNKQMDLGINIS